MSFWTTVDSVLRSTDFGESAASLKVCISSCTLPLSSDQLSQVKGSSRGLSNMIYCKKNTSSARVDLFLVTKSAKSDQNCSSGSAAIAVKSAVSLARSV